MSNLQPLKWTTESDTPSAKSPLHYYDIIREYSCGESCFVRYQRVEAGCNVKQATGFSTFEDAKTWAWNHYNEKMQPYVVPSQVWISVDDRLPESKELLTDKDKCVVLTECGKVWTGFYNMHIKPDEWYLHGWTEKQGWHPFKIVAWMLASDLSKQGE
ncbi:MAG: hypothetical protein ACTH7L_13905 [Psychrobacter alimentarius]